MCKIAPQNYGCAELHRKIVIVQNYTTTSPQTIIWEVGVRNQRHEQLPRRFPDARNFAVVLIKKHVEENILRLTRRSYAQMRRSDRNLLAIDTATADASQLRVATP